VVGRGLRLLAEDRYCCDPISGPWARRGAGQAPISGHPARAQGRFVAAYGPLTRGSAQIRLGDRTLIGCT
jgi:hypothetical protein